MTLEITELGRLLRQESEYINSDLPQHVYSPSESVLGLKVLAWISGSSQPEDIKTKIEQLPIGDGLKSVCHDLVGAAYPAQIDQISALDPEALASDLYGSWLQNSLVTDIRKQYAANYTQDADKIVSQIDLDRSFIRRIIDPFAGSGRLLTAYLNSLTGKEIQQIELVHANELMPTAALLSLARLQLLHQDLPVLVTTNNGFDVRGDYDLVIMNPPFTRSHNITPEIKQSLKELSRSYEDDYQQSGLHIWSIYLADALLNHNGVVLSVLPAAAIMSRYSQSLKQFILSNYHDITIWTFQRAKAYSEGSSLKELLLQATKGPESREVAFTTLEPDLEDLRTFTITSDQLRSTWNWTALYSRPELIRFVESLQVHLDLKNADELGLDIVRGIELYGPNFFFFPNKYWKLNYPQVYNDEYRFHFANSRLVPILRKPSLYKKRVSPEISQYCLVVDDLDEDLERYARVNAPEAVVSKKRFGEGWLQHTRDQIASKQPRGHLFIIDKLDLCRSSVLCHYTDRSYLCTKNFYVLKTVGRQAKLHAAWMNSSMYLSLYLVFRREIGGTYGRMQIMDYYNQQLFLPDISLLDTPQVHQAFDDLREQNLPFLDKQVEEETKKALDTSIAQALDLDVDIEFLYAFIQAEFEELKVRS